MTPLYKIIFMYYIIHNIHFNELIFHLALVPGALSFAYIYPILFKLAVSKVCLQTTLGAIFGILLLILLIFLIKILTLFFFLRTIISNLVLSDITVKVIKFPFIFVMSIPIMGFGFIFNLFLESKQGQKLLRYSGGGGMVLTGVKSKGIDSSRKEIPTTSDLRSFNPDILQRIDYNYNIRNEKGQLPRHMTEFFDLTLQNISSKVTAESYVKTTRRLEEILMVSGPKVPFTLPFMGKLQPQLILNPTTIWSNGLVFFDPERDCLFNSLTNTAVKLVRDSNITTKVFDSIVLNNLGSEMYEIIFRDTNIFKYVNIFESKYQTIKYSNSVCDNTAELFAFKTFLTRIGKEFKREHIFKPLNKSSIDIAHLCYPFSGKGILFEQCREGTEFYQLKTMVASRLTQIDDGIAWCDKMFKKYNKSENKDYINMLFDLSPVSSEKAEAFLAAFKESSLISEKAKEHIFFIKPDPDLVMSSITESSNILEAIKKMKNDPFLRYDSFF
jgi:hypothetical protein